MLKTLTIARPRICRMQTATALAPRCSRCALCALGLSPARRHVPITRNRRTSLVARFVNGGPPPVPMGAVMSAYDECVCSVLIVVGKAVSSIPGEGGAARRGYRHC